MLKRPAHLSCQGRHSTHSKHENQHPRKGKKKKKEQANYFYCKKICISLASWSSPEGILCRPGQNVESSRKLALQQTEETSTEHGGARIIQRSDMSIYLGTYRARWYIVLKIVLDIIIFGISLTIRQLHILKILTLVLLLRGETVVLLPDLLPRSQRLFASEEEGKLRQAHTTILGHFDGSDLLNLQYRWPDP